VKDKGEGHVMGDIQRSMRAAFLHHHIADILSLADF
jgi:hypothetical protein